MDPTPSSAGPESLLKRLRSATPGQRLAGRNRTKADILFYRCAGVDLAVKDYSARPWWIRNTLGRWLLRREQRAYGAACGVAGLPRLVGRPGAFELALERAPGRPLAELSRGAVDAEVFDRVQRILDALHARGVALGDLHHRDVLVARDGSVHLVDLATARVAGPRPGPLGRWLFERWRDADRVALARLRARFAGGDPDAAVAAAGARAAAWHRRGRLVKRWLDRLRGRSR